MPKWVDSPAVSGQLFTDRPPRRCPQRNSKRERERRILEKRAKERKSEREREKRERKKEIERKRKREDHRSQKKRKKEVGVLQRPGELAMTHHSGLGLMDAGWPMQGTGAQ